MKCCFFLGSEKVTEKLPDHVASVPFMLLIFI